MGPVPSPGPQRPKLPLPVTAALFGCGGCFAALLSVVVGLWLLTAWAASRQGGDEQGAIRAGRAAVKAFNYQVGVSLLHESPEDERAVRYTWNNERASRPGGTPQSPTWLVTGTVTGESRAGSKTTNYRLVLTWGAGDEYLVQDFSVDGTRLHMIDGRTVHPDPD